MAFFKDLLKIKKEYKNMAKEVDSKQQKLTEEHLKMAKEYRKFSQKVNKRFDD
ncbi:hypothetical protein KDZ21_03805 [Lactobacillus crispatus]|nr:hypothetical protein [Lactobacillus crispatus]MBW0443726.1 hypothetical protein [Lactobacillus crispatus]MBW0455824.1 hypothetical protein [Lactobacillus crispatus]